MPHPRQKSGSAETGQERQDSAKPGAFSDKAIEFNNREAPTVRNRFWNLGGEATFGVARAHVSYVVRRCGR